MSKVRILALAVAWSVLAGGTIRAADVYVVRFDTTGSPVLAEPPCTERVYRDNLVFYNSGSADVSIGLLGVSNGTASNPQPLTVEAGRARSSQGDETAASTWAPDPQPALWVSHIDVPDQVQVVSRILVIAGRSAACTGFPDSAAHTYASIAMPVVRTLTAPSVPQIHLETDIGSDDGRTNIGIYNGGTVAALATAELRRACDGALLETRTGFIPSNTIIQLNNFSNVVTSCSAIRTAPWEAYVVVTVDQPSFSYAVTLSNQRPPWIPVSSSP